MPDQDLPLAVFAHPGIPTPSWEPRCAICRLARDNQEAHAWVTEALLNQSATQEDIAAELQRRWGIKAAVSQLSRHRTRHLLPDLVKAHEIWVAAQTILTTFGDLPPLELAQKVNQVTLLRLSALLDEADPKLAASLGSAIAALSRGLVQGAQAEVDVETAAHDLELQKVRLVTERADYQREFTRFVREHYPHLLPALQAASADGAGEKEAV